MNATQELLTAAELAEIVRLKPARILKLAREGRIPAIRISHKLVRFDAQAVIERLKGVSDEK